MYIVSTGYNESEVQEQIDKATNKNREELLTPREGKSELVFLLVVTYHPDLPRLTLIFTTISV